MSDPAAIADGVIDGWVRDDNRELILYYADQLLALLREADAEDWPGWIVYLLEGLDQHDRGNLEIAVMRVEGCIATRMAEGRW